MANTTQGKAVSARNATTHGLFCRQAVLPHLGESPDAYKNLLDALFAELPPRNLMERQYLELWAEASWKLRRLSRWEAQAWESDTLGEDERLTKLERLTRLQATLRRQLDKAVRMLHREVSALYAGHLRGDILADLGMTEDDCRRDRHSASIAAKMVRGEREAQRDEAEERLEALQRAALDNAPAPDAEKCQNELPTDDNKNCQNEPAPPSPPAPSLPLLGSSVASWPSPQGVRALTFHPAPPPSPRATIKQFARACAQRE